MMNNRSKETTINFQGRFDLSIPSFGSHHPTEISSHQYEIELYIVDLKPYLSIRSESELCMIPGLNANLEELISSFRFNSSMSELQHLGHFIIRTTYVSRGLFSRQYVITGVRFFFVTNDEGLAIAFKLCYSEFLL